MSIDKLYKVYRVLFVQKIHCSPCLICAILEADFHNSRRKSMRGWFPFPADARSVHLLEVASIPTRQFLGRGSIMSEKANVANKTSAAKRRANDKWDKENMVTIACKLRKEDAEAFRAFASQEGKAVNTLLKNYVFSCIGKSDSKEPSEDKQD